MFKTKNTFMYIYKVDFNEHNFLLHSFLYKSVVEKIVTLPTEN